MPLYLILGGIIGGALGWALGYFNSKAKSNKTTGETDAASC